MGTPLLREVLENWKHYELDDDIYMPAGSIPSLDTPVTILPFDRLRPRAFDGLEYVLSFEQVRDVIIGLEARLCRTATPQECLRAVVHYAHHDAFIDPSTAVKG